MGHHFFGKYPFATCESYTKKNMSICRVESNLDTLRLAKRFHPSSHEKDLNEDIGVVPQWILSRTHD